MTILAVFFAIFLSVAMRGMQYGTYASNIRMATQIFTGFLQIQHEDFKDNPSLRKSFVLTDTLEQALRKNKFIKNFTERVYGYGLAAFEDNTVGAAVFGIDPATEKGVSTLMKKVIEGRGLDNSKPYDIIVGETMAKNLKAGVGDTLVILSSDYYGTMGNLKFRIGGLSRMGSPQFDNRSVFMTLSAARELMAMPERISVVAISLHNIEDLDQAANSLEKDLNDTNLAVLDWGEIMPDFKQSIEFDNISGVLMLAILIIVVAFGILNTVLMSVTERFREFGVMLALGTPHRTLLAVVFLETLFLTFIGLIVGVIFASALNYYFIVEPITFTGDMAEMMQQYGFEPIMTSSLNPIVFIENVLVIFITALLVFIYPGYRIMKLEPLKGIRYT